VMLTTKTSVFRGAAGSEYYSMWRHDMKRNTNNEAEERTNDATAALGNDG
jgi:hypothetical protein